MKHRLDELRVMAPLYVQGKLQEAEREIFEKGLKQFPQLQGDLEAYRLIGSYYKEVEMKTASPSKKIFALVENGLKEQNSESSFNSATVERLKSWFSNIFTMPHVGWGIAAVQCAVILFLLIPSQRGARYETLSMSEPAVPEQMTLQLVFNEKAQEKEIRRIIHSIKGNIVAGPSSEGMYQVSLPDDSNIEGTVKELRSKKSIVFVEKAL